MALRAEQIEVTLAHVLETSRKAAGLSQDDFWFLYKQSGGVIGLAAFKNYLRGLSDPQWHEYDIMAKVLNEALGEERLPRLPFLRSSEGLPTELDQTRRFDGNGQSPRFDPLVKAA